MNTEVGTDYYHEVIAPEFRSAARGVFARHSYLDLLRKNEQIEDEIEGDLRRRTTGEPVWIASVTLEAIQYTAEIAKAIQEKLTAEQDAGRQKALLENEATRRKLNLQIRPNRPVSARRPHCEPSNRRRSWRRHKRNWSKFRAESEAEKRVIAAKAEAEESRLVSRAKSEQLKSENQALTPLAVMMRGYEALESLGRANTHILLGDWSHVPNFLFPGLPALKTEATPREGGKL